MYTGSASRTAMVSMEYVSNGKFAQVDVFPAACYLQSAPIVLLLNQINFYKFTSSQVLTIA